MEDRIKLGDEVKCTITGFKGIAYGRCNYLYGCEQILVKPMKLDKDGKVQDSKWIDEPQVDLIKSKKVKKARPKHGPSTERSPSIK